MSNVNSFQLCESQYDTFICLFGNSSASVAKQGTKSRCAGHLGRVVMQWPNKEIKVDLQVMRSVHLISRPNTGRIAGDNRLLSDGRSPCGL